MLKALLRLTVAAVALAVPAGALAAGEAPLTALDATYEQHFDDGALASSGTSSTLPEGWALAESGTNANATYSAGTGSATAGDTYSFGATAATERAFGGLQSGSLVPTIGGGFRNDAGAILTSLDVGYTGEQWRLGTTGRGSDRIDFQYSVDATSLTDGTWTNVDTLDFSSPFTAAVGAVDGNAPGNRLDLDATIGGLSILPGQTFWLRWTDFNASGSDDGLAVDDFSLTPHGTVVTNPVLTIGDATVAEGDSGTTDATFTIALTRPAGAGGVTFDVGTADGTATAASGDYTARSGSLTIPEGETTTTFTVQVDGDMTIEPDETFFVNVTNVVGADAGDAQGVGTITNDDLPPPMHVHDVQGAAHLSPIVGQRVTNLQGIVTQKVSNGFFMTDPDPDANPATSEGIFVFGTISAGLVAIGDRVGVDGSVQEFRPSNTATNLTTTEIGNTFVHVLSHGNALPTPTSWSPPTETIEDDATGDVETSGVFDPGADGLDYAEAHEGEQILVQDATATGPSRVFASSSTNEVPVVGAGAGVRTPRGGIVIRANDFNPERIILQTGLGGLPAMNVGDHIPGATIGALDYNFGNYKLRPAAPVSVLSGGLQAEVTADQTPQQLSVATFNVENLDPLDGAAKFNRLAAILVGNLKAPAIVALEEVQDDNGPTDDGTVASNVTLDTLVAAIEAAGGPHYSYRYVVPVNDADGGEPGGNIRVAFLFDASRVTFVDRGSAGSLDANDVVGTGASTHLLYSPGRIDPTSAAWTDSRKPLAAEFVFRGHKVFVIANHFNSKGGDDPLMGRFQPPKLVSEVQRRQQATEVRDFVGRLLTADPTANVIVAGDLNDFQFSRPLEILKEAGLHALIETLPVAEQYTYDFDGNSQAIDHILVSPALDALVHAGEYDVVHVNAEFADQASDHDPQVVRLLLNDAPSADAGGPYTVAEGSVVQVSATANDPEGGPLDFAWDLDGDGSFETHTQSAAFSAAAIDGPATRTIRLRVVDDAGTVATDSATVNVTNVPPTATLVAPVTVFAGDTFTIAVTNAHDAAPADTITFAFDCGGVVGFGPFGAATSAGCPTHDTGTRMVGLKVADDDHGVSTYTASVNVVVTVDSLCALTKRYVSKPAIGGALCEKLAVGDYRAYVNQLNAQIGKSLTPTQAAILKRLVGRL